MVSKDGERMSVEHVDEGSTPLPSALFAQLIDEAPDGSMVKRIATPVRWTPPVAAWSSIKGSNGDAASASDLSSIRPIRHRNIEDFKESSMFYQTLLLCWNRSRPTVMPHGPFFILKFGRRTELKLYHVWWTQIPSKYPSFLESAKPLFKKAYWDVSLIATLLHEQF